MHRTSGELSPAHLHVELQTQGEVGENTLHCAKISLSSYFLDSLTWLVIKTGSAIVTLQKHKSSVLKNTLSLLPQEDILKAGTLGGTIWLPAFSSVKVVKFVFVLKCS